MKLRTAAFFLPLVLTACTTVSKDDPRRRLELPAGFESAAESFTVTPKEIDYQQRQPLAFGDFQVVDFQAGFSQASHQSSPVLPPYLEDPVGVKASAGSSAKTFQFELASAGQPRWLARCRFVGHDDSIAVRGVPISATIRQNLVCALDDLESAAEWKLTFEAYGSLRSFKGTAYGELTDGTTRYEIVMLNRFVTGATAPVPLGYRFDRGDTTIAALTFVPEHTVYVTRDPGSRSLMAAAMSALLLHPH